jgi:hypothetical protein
MSAQGFRVDPPRLGAHIESVRKLVHELAGMAGPVAGLYPAGDPSWTGTERGGPMLRDCLREIAEVVRRTSAGVNGRADQAAACLTEYVALDKRSAQRISGSLKSNR